MNGVRASVDNVDYIKITNAKVKIKVNGIKMKFENLFGGNKGIESAANELINQNSQLVLKDAIPKFEKVMAGIAMKASNQFFSQVPADQLFP